MLARKGRIISNTGIYHILLRGNNGLFFSQADYNEFLTLLKKYFSENASLFAYSLGNNKIHLIISTKSSPSGKLKPLCICYARYINRTYNKAGKLFYDRFVSEPIENNHALFNALRYVLKIPADISSADEYTQGQNLCDTKSLKQLIDIEKLNSDNMITPINDDYAAMSDEELKKHILRLSGIKNSSHNQAKLKKYIIDACYQCNLSKSRLMRIFSINGYYSSVKKKEISTAKKEKKQQEEIQNKKRELSVWLL